jgi:hypothetical protein
MERHKSTKIIISILIIFVSTLGIIAIWTWAQSDTTGSTNSLLTKPHSISSILLERTSKSQDISSEPALLAYTIYKKDIKNEIESNINFQGKASVKLISSPQDTLQIYDLELRENDDTDKEQKLPLLGLPEESDWLIMGPIDNNLLTHEFVAYDMFRQIGHYSPRTRFVKLYINGSHPKDNYQGTFLLTERIKRDRNRLDISKLKPDQNEGSFILEMTPKSNIDNSHFSTYRNNNFIIRYPKEDEITQNQKDYIIGYIDSFEKTLYSWEFKDPEKGYRRYLDVDSAIDYIIFNELFRNNDAFYSNTYMYVEDGKLHFGPLWDINSDMEEISLQKESCYKGWYVVNTQWNDRLFRDKFFVDKFRARWRELRNNHLSKQRIETTINYYQRMSGTTKVKGLNHDFSKWLINRAKWIDNNITYLSNKFIEDNYPIATITKVTSQINSSKEVKAQLSIYTLKEHQRNKVWQEDYKEIDTLITEAELRFNNPISIKQRGQSSKIFPKKQYNIETKDNNGHQTNVSLLDFPTESDWVLYGPYSDKTIIRNVLAYELSNQIGLYAPKTQIIELFLTGERNISHTDYQGVYVLTEKIKRGQRRVDISKSLQSETSTPFIVELSDTKKDLSSNQVLYTDMSLATKEEFKYVYIHTYPKNEMLTEAKARFIREHINHFEKILYSYNGKELYEKLDEYIDIDTFIDYYILNEIFKNPDAFWASDYFYKDTKGKLSAGPIWDFNVAMGNIDFIDNKPEGWLIRYRKLIIRMMGNTYFKQRCFERLNEILINTFNDRNINFVINSYKTQLSRAQNRNFKKWPILGVAIWPNPTPIPNNYETEVAALQTWLKKRALWLSKQI